MVQKGKEFSGMLCLPPLQLYATLLPSNKTEKEKNFIEGSVAFSQKKKARVMIIYPLSD